MLVSNNKYQLFFKKLTNLEGKSLSSSQLKVKSFNINRDLLTKAKSSFQVLEMPSAVENGDVVGMYDSFGTILYLGVVDYIDDNTIEAQQMYEVFDDEWLYRDPRRTTLEETIKAQIENIQFDGDDVLQKSIFDAFDLETTSQTEQMLESQESNYVTNMSRFYYSIYEKYSIILDFEIPFNEVRPKIKIGKPNFNKLQIGNNGVVFRNFDIVSNIYETNKLILYSEETNALRGVWYGTSSGITTNASALNRPQKIKTSIVFSDESTNIILASHLRNQMYNHEITCEMVLDNKVLSFDNLHLGQEVDIYFDSNYYNTILTGYSLNMVDNVSAGVITLKFGLVRSTLTSKLFKRLRSGN